MARKQLTADQIRAAIVASGCHYVKAAEQLGIKPCTLWNRVKALREAGEEFPESLANVPADPTPEEIEAASAAIQRGWSKAERWSRSVTKVGPFEVPQTRWMGEETGYSE